MSSCARDTGRQVVANVYRKRCETPRAPRSLQAMLRVLAAAAFLVPCAVSSAQGAGAERRLHAPRAQRAAATEQFVAHQRRPIESATLAALPVAFIENQGQWDESLAYAAHSGALNVGVRGDGLSIQTHERDGRETRTAALRLTIEGASRSTEIVGEDRLPGEHHFLLGADESRWRSHVPGFASVTCRSVLAGADLRVGFRDSRFEYDLLCDASMDPSQVVFAVDGALSMRIGAGGELVLRSALGELIQHPPVAWYERPDGERVATGVRFALLDEARFVFELLEPRQALPLVIDPPLEWSSYFGGSQSDRAYAIAIDALGRIAVAGETTSVDLPTASSSSGLAGDLDVFVSVLDPASSALVFSTYLGGMFDDRCWDMGIDAGGRITITGQTNSFNFPSTPQAFDPSFNHPTPFTSDGFVARMEPDGSGLVYSTFLGGANEDTYLWALAVDGAGFVTVAGGSRAITYPVTPGAFDTTHSLGLDVVVTRLRPDGGSLVYSTLIGSSGEEWAFGLDLLPDGSVVVAGRTHSNDYPVTPGAFMGSPISGEMGFVSRLKSNGSQLLASTLIGGTGTNEIEVVRSGPSGLVFVAGWTSASFGYPVTPGAVQTNVGSALFTGFVSQLDANLSTLLHSTFFGSVGTDATSQVLGLAVDASGVATITGYTNNQTLLTTPGCFSATQGFGDDSFVARLTPDFSRLLYSSYLGGSVQVPGGEKSTRASDLAVREDGAAIVVGWTAEADFPVTSGALQPQSAGKQDVFVTEFTMLPIGVEKYGASTPGCLGPIYAGVLKQPLAGDPTFGLFSSASPSSALGGLVLAAAPAPLGIPLIGVTVWIDPLQSFSVLPAVADAHGWCEKGVPLPAGTSGLTAHCQFIWVDVVGCGVQGAFSASNALSVTVQ